jgi:hypothetical protein
MATREPSSRLHLEGGVAVANCLSKVGDPASEQHALFAENEIVKTLTMSCIDVEAGVHVGIDESVIEYDGVRIGVSPRPVLEARR